MANYKDLCTCLTYIDALIVEMIVSIQHLQFITITMHLSHKSLLNNTYGLDCLKLTLQVF